MSAKRSGYAVAKDIVHIMDLGSYGEQCIPMLTRILDDWLDEWIKASRVTETNTIKSVSRPTPRGDKP